MIPYEETHKYFKNDYQFLDTLKTKDRKIGGNFNLFIKVKFHELELNKRCCLTIFKNKIYG